MYLKATSAQSKIFPGNNLVFYKPVSQKKPLAGAQSVLLVHKKSCRAHLKYYENCHQGAEKESLK